MIKLRDLLRDSDALKALAPNTRSLPNPKQIPLILNVCQSKVGLEHMALTIKPVRCN